MSDAVAWIDELCRLLRSRNGDCSLIETHISWLLLSGDSAYKLKKPLDLGFLDFSTLERRRFCCEEELRLNRRLAADWYLKVMPLRRFQGELALGPGPGEVIDYTVWMRRFPEDALLVDHPQRLDFDLASRLARKICRFHQVIPTASSASDYGREEQVLQPMLDNFRQIRDSDPVNALWLQRLDRLEQWTRSEFQRLRPVLRQRRKQGHIRECHGDLHLGNITLQGGSPVIFDAIEFNPVLRWIDTISEMAFLLMDLQHVGRVDIAGSLLNDYLECSGDYAGLEVLRFYQLYRAMVRLKVELIRLGQMRPGGDPRSAPPGSRLESYLALGESYVRPLRPVLLITHGLSGSGKSWLGQKLCRHLPIIRLRSDVERKRLSGLSLLRCSGSAPDQGLYSRERTEATYGRLLDLSRRLIGCGWPVLVDATFLDRSRRQSFRELAGRLGVDFAILEFQQPVELLRRRIEQRQKQGGDPSEADLAVLELQLSRNQPLDAGEQRQALDATVELPQLLHQLCRRFPEVFANSADCGNL